MIQCPKCQSAKWRNDHRCPIDPYSDKFTCRDCGHQFKRGDDGAETGPIARDPFFMDVINLEIGSPYLRGKADRMMGRPCASSDGRYLEGWYSV